jgi:predicted AlkP superfamily phosphohydrolase/phosphomutase
VDVCVLGATPESWGEVHEALSVRSEETLLMAVAAYGLAPARVRVNVARVLADAGLLCYCPGAQGAEAVGFERVDWARTRAFSWGSFAQVRLNLRGREPEGVVVAEERERTVAEVKQALLHVEHPETGERLFTEALTPEELYPGPNVGAAADVLGLSAPGVDASIHIAAPDAPLLLVAEGETTVPTREGRLLAAGPAFRAGDGEAVPRAARSALGLGEPTIMDVGPTLLHALGLPLPPDVDGRPIRRVFDPGYLAEHPPRCSEARLGRHEAPGQPAYSQEEAEQVEKRLRDLGYM